MGARPITLPAAARREEPGIDALLLVDLFDDFSHPQGGTLLASLRERAGGFERALHRARDEGTPVLFANDARGTWDGDAPAFVRDTLARSPGGAVLARLAPAPGEAFLFKLRYSAFDHTALQPLLSDRGVERILLGGMSTERCVTQTAIAARERGFKVTLLTGATATADAPAERIALDYLERIVGVRLA